MNEPPPTEARGWRSRRRAGRIGPWLLWIAAAVASGLGLQHYRVDNDLSRWAPDLAAAGAVRSYALVGFERAAFDEYAIAAALCSLPTTGFCIDSAYLEQVGAVWDGTPEDFVLSRDGAYAGIYVFRSPDCDDEAFVRQIRAGLAGFDGDLGRFALAGPAVFHVAINTYSQARLAIIMGLINGLGGCWLWWITGRMRAAATGVAAILTSQIVLLGIVSWQHVAVDMSLSMVPPLIMALGYSYAAHRALRRNIAGTLILCCGTTAAGIASLAISGLAPLQTFALYATLGMGLVWLAVVTLLPSPGPGDRSARPRSRRLKPLVGCHLAAVTRHGWAITAVAVGVAVASVGAVGHLRFDTNPLDYFPPDARITRDFATINARLTGTLPFQVIVKGASHAVDPTEMLRHTPGVRKILNVSTVMPGASATYWGLAGSDAIPALVAAQPAWQSWADANDVVLQWRGVAAQIDATGGILRRAAMMAIPTMALIAALSVGWLTRSVRMAVVGAVVNVLPVGGMVLVAAVAGLSLGLPALMIGAIAIGMALDDTIHLVRAFAQRRSIWRGLLRCQRPCVGSTLVAASCMALFVISPFRPTQQFGTLLAATALIALAIDLLLLPVLAPRTHKPHVPAE